MIPALINDAPHHLTLYLKMNPSAEKSFQEKNQILKTAVNVFHFSYL